MYHDIHLEYDTPAKLYIIDIIPAMRQLIDGVTSALTMFLENGLPAIRVSQDRSSTNLLNLSTTATFFSAVTATTLQMSYQTTETLLQRAVNTFYFASLILSVAAAVNSLLGLAWTQAT